MDPNRKITKKFIRKFDSKAINRQNFHRKTGLQSREKVKRNAPWFSEEMKQSEVKRMAFT